MISIQMLTLADVDGDAIGNSSVNSTNVKSLLKNLFTPSINLL